MKIGIISDTHGKIPAEVFNAFESVDQIWHAGDIGSSDIITELETIAPVIAVRGNVDGFPASMKLPLFESIEINQSHFLLTHRFLDHQMRPFHGIDLSIAYNCKAVIYGHTHQPKIKYHGSVLYFNPGSAAFPRHSNKPSVGVLNIDKLGKIDPQIVYITKNT